MKKQFFFLLSLLVAFSLLFVSCDENEQDSNICKITVIHDGDGTVSITENNGTSVDVLIGSQVEVVATPAVGCAFTGWYLSDGETLVSTEAKFIFTASENTTLIARFEKLFNLTIRSTGYGSVSFKDSADDSLAFLPGSEVTVVATPNADCDFIGWFVGDAETPVSTDTEYTFTVTEDVNLIAKFEETNFSSGSIDGYEYVDLGLSVKWATCNVGANSPEEYGSYYAWGETEEKSNYYWDTYKWCNGSSSKMTKYCTSSSYGTVDNKTVLDLEDDVAHVKWGGSWRMPTKEEQNELFNDCTWTWTTQNGVNGYKVIGSNGNSIFLPAAGYRYGTSLYLEGSGGSYWSSTPNGYSSDLAYDLGFGSGYCGWYSNFRLSGQSVRPVSK